MYMADDVQTILNSLNENPFIRSVIANNEKKQPNIVCFTDVQLEDLRNCMTSDSIIGVDRTFSLGPCMVYQNHNLIRKNTKSSPIMLGPMFFTLGRLVFYLL